MPRYAIKVQYDGTPYVGYQVQPNGPSVQAAIEKALCRMAKLPSGQHIPTSGSGRTDSGVHALGQVIHFDYPASIHPKAMQRAFNSLLDTSIRVTDVAQVAETFHARYDVTEKEYIYRVDVGQFPDPFKRHYTLHHPYRYDLAKMQRAICDIVGTHDFTSFCSTKTDKEDKVRTVYEATIMYDEEQHELRFYFRGNGFLYNMIRILVGTLLQIGDGLRPETELQRLLAVCNRKQAGPTAPPQGLYMQRVIYEQDPFNQ
ncbi:tRNA pseudouridine(38-40) synthase TruA [Aerococcaceae bacterium NML160702]|nr:tRNA pseudouridine(38-40) synthase TruA [Aerococcaceae bacterium NML160702]